MDRWLPNFWMIHGVSDDITYNIYDIRYIKSTLQRGSNNAPREISNSVNSLITWVTTPGTQLLNHSIFWTNIFYWIFLHWFAWFLRVFFQLNMRLLLFFQFCLLLSLSRAKSTPPPPGDWSPMITIAMAITMITVIMMVMMITMIMVIVRLLTRSTLGSLQYRSWRTKGDAWW